MAEVTKFFDRIFSSIFGKLVDIDALLGWFIARLPRLIGALLVFAVGWWLSGAIANLMVRTMERAKVDKGISTFLHSCVKVIIKVIVIVSALSTLGMNVTTLVAAIGTAGVTVALALKDSLSNFASGVIILFSHTFKVGDFIEISEHSGTVKRIELMFTTLATSDNKRIVIPNSVITSDMVVNYTAKDIRRLDLKIGVAYGSDILVVKKAIMTALKNSSSVNFENEPVVGIASFDDSAITFDIKVWVSTKIFNTSHYEINENILAELNKAGIEIPFNQLDVHMVEDNA